MFFEGSEKKVEILIRKDRPSLRQDRARWERVVAKANAAILSSISNDRCDAYLLSESSLFVFDRRLIMITCGATTLITAIEEILSFVALDDIQLLMYERKNEHNPDAQPTTFAEDAASLRRFVDGDVLHFGDRASNRVHLFHYCRQFEPDADDMTLEILMHDLDASVRDIFRAGLTAKTVYEQTGINEIFPHFTVDDHLFTPMGYSMNAIKDDEYYTFHVTPEEAFSYASFETNHVFGDDLGATIDKVLGMFKPGHFALVLFESDGSQLVQPAGHRITARSLTPSCGFRVHFHNLERM